MHELPPPVRPPTTPQQRLAGVLWTIAAMGLLAGMAGFAKAAAQEGAGVLHILLGRSLVVTLLGLAVALLRGEPLLGQRRGLLALRGLAGVGALLLFLVAVTRITVGETIVVHKANPLFVALLAPWLLGERAGRATLIAIPIGLAGVALIVRPGLPVEATVGGLAAIGSALLTAFAYLYLRALTLTEASSTIVFWLGGMGVLVGLAGLAPDFTLPPQRALWLIACGGACAGTGQFLLTRAFRLLDAASASTASYSQVAFGYLLGWLALGETSHPLAWLGTLLVVAACLVVAWSKGPGSEVRPRS